MTELDTVVLAEHLPDHNLTPGDMGTVVHDYDDGNAVEVEFVNVSGETVAIVTLDRDRIRAIEDTDIPHARSIQ